MTCYNVLQSHKCGVYIYTLDAIYDACIISAEVILILRTYALWGRSRRVLAVLLALAAAFIAAATVLASSLKFSLPEDSGSPYVFYPSACAYQTSRDGAFEYIFLMAYEIVLQGMNTWRKFRTYRNVRSQTLNTLYRDGIMYMFWIILLSTVNMVVMVTAPLAYIPSLDTAQVAIHGVLASRIFFNLRECDERIHDSGSEFGGISMTSLHYRSRSAGRQQRAEDSTL
ncbi:hypothetical protein BS17DRAFT_779861 [Gyrodon lividus]|nr:hypothetical protein BS17DRAFT_779861 [Gyrodon lividus]